MLQTIASHRTSSFVTELQTGGALIAAILVFAYLRHLPLGFLVGGLASFGVLLFASQLLRREIAERVEIQNTMAAWERVCVENENTMNALERVLFENEKQRGELLHAMEELHVQIRTRTQARAETQAQPRAQHPEVREHFLLSRIDFVVAMPTNLHEHARRGRPGQSPGRSSPRI